jgi:hypothetical protein
MAYPVGCARVIRNVSGGKPENGGLYSMAAFSGRSEDMEEKDIMVYHTAIDR